jgi:uncharacterized membrane protein YdjX (TVP38/TMEM64 family)
VVTGTLLVSFASRPSARRWPSLPARYLLRDGCRTRFGARLKGVNEGMARDGAFYLFSLRLVPVFPFFAVNLLMGLTPIRTWTYYWVSQVGMLLGTVVYVNAGTQLARIESLSDIASPGLLASFAALACCRGWANGSWRAQGGGGSMRAGSGRRGLIATGGDRRRGGRGSSPPTSPPRCGPR